jgi:hypothetical protein
MRDAPLLDAVLALAAGAFALAAPAVPARKRELKQVSS